MKQSILIILALVFGLAISTWAQEVLPLDGGSGRGRTSCAPAGSANKIVPNTIAANLFIAGLHFV